MKNRSRTSRPALAPGRSGGAATRAAYVQQATALEDQGRIEEAVAALTAAAAQSPRDADIQLWLGNLLAGLRRWPAAERAYASVCQEQPQNAVALRNWGIALHEQGKFQDAIPCFERAIAVSPQYAEAYYSLGIAYRMSKVPQAALLAFNCAMQIDRGDARFGIEQARTHIDLGEHAQALQTLGVLAREHPRNANVHNLTAIALRHLDRQDEALVALDSAIALKPDLFDAIYNRANIRLKAREFSLAIKDYDRALSLKPDFDWLRGTRLYAAAHIFDWSNYAVERAAVAEAVKKHTRVIQPLSLQTLEDDPALHQMAARVWTLASFPALASRPAAAAQPSASAAEAPKIRIAYISKDFTTHPVSFLMAEVIELHDRERFEVIGINYGPVLSNPMQERLRASFDRFLDLEQWSDSKIASLSRQLGVHIAVDLSGFTSRARNGIFACRAAPVQVSYLGYLGTAGADLYDYLIADDTLIPTDFRRYYDEKIAYLPSYQANDRRRPSPAMPARRSELGLPDAGFVFCCFNNPCKITPEVFALWTRILAQVPGSVLWLLDEGELAPQNLRRHAQALNIDPQRIVFAKRAGREDYLANLRTADLFLDTLPYNAGTTASDALWMGLPVLTQMGRSFSGRVAASLLRAIELPELIAHDADNYVERAIQLAQQPALLATLREKLGVNRTETRLFDAPRFTRSLESAYREMHRQSMAAEPLRDIHVAD